MFAPGKVVTALQIEFAYDSEAVTIESVEGTEALAAQEKEVWHVEPKPGSLRVIVAGANQYPILNNEIVRIRYRAGTPVTREITHAIRLAAVSAATPDGDSADLIITDKARQSGPRRDNVTDRELRNPPRDQRWRPRKAFPIYSSGHLMGQRLRQITMSTLELQAISECSLSCGPTIIHPSALCVHVLCRNYRRRQAASFDEARAGVNRSRSY
jgi:hypothetical protein